MKTKLSCAILASLGLAIMLASSVVSSKPPRSGALDMLAGGGASEHDRNNASHLPSSGEKPTVYPPVAPSVRSPIEGNSPLQRPWTEGDPVKVRPDLQRSGGDKK